MSQASLLQEVTTLVFCGAALNISELEKISPSQFLPINTFLTPMKANHTSEEITLDVKLMVLTSSSSG